MWLGSSSGLMLARRRSLNAFTVAASHGSAEAPSPSVASIKSASQMVLGSVLGKAEMQVSHLLKLGRGAVIELDRKVGEAIDIYVNNRLVARGEVVVVEDRLGITMTEIIKSDRNA